MSNIVKLKLFDNKWYKPGGRIKIFLWFIFNNLFVNSYYPIPIFFKIFLLKFFGAKIGRNVIIKPKVNIKYPWLLHIGNDSWIGENVWIDNLAKVTIGSNVCISQGAMLLCGNHNYKKNSFDLIIEEIVIENGAWVGAKSIVCPGVKLNSHCVLTAGSVASNDLQSYFIYKGNPSKKIRERVIE